MSKFGRFALLSLIVTLVLTEGLVLAIQYLASNSPDGGGQAATLYVLAFVVALVLWGLLLWIARGSFQADDEHRSPPEVAQSSPQPRAEPKPKPAAVAEPSVDAQKFVEMGAMQMLTILQRKGRLIDFLQEDIAPYDDVQIGAAVRSIHDGCREALFETVVLEPVLSDSENSVVTVPPGFDAHAIRLSGGVSGQPPFSGALRHRGWRVQSVNLPQRTRATEGEFILAPAEVEVQ